MAPNPSTMSYDQLLQTSQDFIAALSSLDVDKMLALRAPDCQHIILPTSLGRKGMSNEEYDISRSFSLSLSLCRNQTGFPSLSSSTSKLPNIFPAFHLHSKRERTENLTLRNSDSEPPTQPTSPAPASRTITSPPTPQPSMSTRRKSSCMPVARRSRWRDRSRASIFF